MRRLKPYAQKKRLKQSPYLKFEKEREKYLSLIGEMISAMMEGEVKHDPLKTLLSLGKTN